MHITREIMKVIREASQMYPVVTVTGPRQAGKSTSVMRCFPDKLYQNLESPDIRRTANDDPRYFLTQSSSGMIIDEFQYVPELLSYIQPMVDVNDIDISRHFGAEGIVGLDGGIELAHGQEYMN